MKIALDYDDTLDLAYPLFSVITNSLIAAGHEVFIVTHIHEEHRVYRENQLKQYNIAYTELVITGDKLYECQKRGIEYIFDDCEDYFKDIYPIHFQVFNIPPLLKKTLEDGTEIECAAKYIPSISDYMRINYEYRIKLKDEKKWSSWEYIYTGKKVHLDDIKSQLGQINTLQELKNIWQKS